MFYTQLGKKEYNGVPIRYAVIQPRGSSGRTVLAVGMINGNMVTDVVSTYERTEPNFVDKIKNKLFGGEFERMTEGEQIDKTINRVKREIDNGLWSSNI